MHEHSMHTKWQSLQQWLHAANHSRSFFCCNSFPLIHHDKSPNWKNAKVLAAVNFLGFQLGPEHAVMFVQSTVECVIISWPFLILWSTTKVTVAQANAFAAINLQLNYFSILLFYHKRFALRAQILIEIWSNGNKMSKLFE